MRMQVQRQLAAGRLDDRNERGGACGRQQPAWILDVNSIDAEGYQLARLPRIIGVRVNWADGIDDAAGSIESDFLCRMHGHLQVAHVVERIIRRVIADSVGENALSG